MQRIKSTYIIYEFENYIHDLKIRFTEYANQARELCHANELLSGYISTKLLPQKKEYWKYKNISWESRNFHGPGGRAGVLTSLERIQKDLYQIHYEILRSMAHKDAPEY